MHGHRRSINLIVRTVITWDTRRLCNLTSSTNTLLATSIASSAFRLWHGLGSIEVLHSDIGLGAGKLHWRSIPISEDFLDDLYFFNHLFNYFFLYLDRLNRLCALLLLFIRRQFGLALLSFCKLELKLFNLFLSFLLQLFNFLFQSIDFFTFILLSLVGSLFFSMQLMNTFQVRLDLFFLQLALFFIIRKRSS